jgi:hypothetical protein
MAMVNGAMKGEAWWERFRTGDNGCNGLVPDRASCHRRESEWESWTRLVQ